MSAARPSASNLSCTLTGPIGIAALAKAPTRVIRPSFGHLVASTPPRRPFSAASPSMAPQPRVPLIFGTMTIGAPGKSGVRTADKGDAQAILDAFAKHGGKEIDTARVYAEGTTEEYLADLNLHGAALDSKAHPYAPGAHSASNVRKSVETTLATLKRDRIRVLYLHYPDRATPFAETMEALHTLHKEGKFEQIGLSNFAAWEVAECVNIARERGWTLPSVYQGMYNGITRAIEDELIPCIRKYGMRLVIYNPLAGGLLTGRLSRDDIARAAIEQGSRFDASTKQGKMYQERYFRDAYFDAIDVVKAAAEKSNINMGEAALRWVQHHSKLTEKDGVIIGASSLAHLNANCEHSTGGPLPQDLIDAFDAAWAQTRGSGLTYWR